VLVQDGLPYKIALKLIRSMRVCELCETETKHIDQHMIDHHKGASAMKHSTAKFGNIVLRAGNGHYEINIVRSIFANFFHIYIEDIAKMLGFKTPNSLEYCKSAADHHKSWQILQVASDNKKKV
jgi:hypothetical protein